MNPFKKKSKIKSPATLQDAQKEFNQALFELGNLNYQSYMVNQEATRLKDLTNQTYQKLDKIGKDAATLRSKVTEAVSETITNVPTEAKADVK